MKIWLYSHEGRKSQKNERNLFFSKIPSINKKPDIDRRTKEPAIKQAGQVMYGALSKGVNFKITMSGIVTLTPPLLSLNNKSKNI